MVDRVDLLRKKQLPWRFDVWPFAIIYGVWVSVILPSLDFVDAAIVLGALAALHVLVWLFTCWSVDFKCFAHYSKVYIHSTCDVYRLNEFRHLLFICGFCSPQVKNIRHADSCKITPAKFSGSKEVVPLHSRNSVSVSHVFILVFLF